MPSEVEFAKNNYTKELGRRWVSPTLRLLIFPMLILILPIAASPDTVTLYPKVTVDSSLANSLNCAPKQGRILANEGGITVSSVGENAQSSITEIMVTDRQGCHIVFPGSDFGISKYPAIFEYNVSPEQRPYVQKRLFSYERRVIEEKMKKAAARCNSLDNLEVDLAYGATKYAVCIERKTMLALRNVRIVFIYEEKDGLRIATQILAAEGKIEGIGRQTYGKAPSELYSEIDLGVSK
jgi:hypothetical protein